MTIRNHDNKEIRSSTAEYLTFVSTTGDRSDSVEMRYEDEDIGLTKKMMATLYDVEVNTVNNTSRRYIGMMN